MRTQPPPQPQIQNLHYNKRSDDYFREALAPREKYNSILNNVNTQTEYSNPLLNSIETQTDNSILNNMDTQTDNSISNNMDTQTDYSYNESDDSLINRAINYKKNKDMQRAFTNFRQNKRIDNTLREKSLIEKATNYKNNYDLQNAFSNLKHNMFLKDEIKNNNDELQRNLPKIIDKINSKNDASSEINNKEPSVLSEEKPSFLNNTGKSSA